MHTRKLFKHIGKYWQVFLIIAVVLMFALLLGVRFVSADEEPDQYISVIPNFQQVGGHHWPEGNTLTLEIDDPDTTENPDFTADTVVVAAPWDPGSETWFEFNLYEYEDFHIDLVRPGNIFTVFDDETIKSLVIEPLFVTGIDPLTKTISGIANPDSLASEVRVDPNPGADNAEWAVYVNGSNVWTAANPDWDIHPYFGGDASQWDDDGDSTQFQMRLPLIEASITNNWIYLFDFNHNTSVTVEIDKPDTSESPDFQVVIPTDNEGQAWLDGWENGIDLNGGDVLTVTDGFSGFVKELILEDFSIEDVDLDENKVWGTAHAGTLVIVEVGYEEREGVEIQADQDGNWVADFDSIGFQIYWDMGVSARVTDPDFDNTIAEPGPPFLHVVPYWAEVHGHEWDWEAYVTMTIDDDEDPNNGILYEASKYVWDDPWCGEPCFDLSGLFELYEGMVVKMTDGKTSRRVIISNLQITNVNTDNNSVSGIGQSGDIVQIDVNEIDQCVIRYAQAGGGGEWNANFTDPQDPEGEDECVNNTHPLDEFSLGRALITKMRHWENGTVAFWPPQIKFLGASLNPVAISDYFDLTAIFEGDVAKMQYSIPNFSSWRDLSYSTVENYGPVEGIANDRAPDTPGVYPVMVEACNSREECVYVLVAYLAVYDPSAGFVTGGGQIIPGGNTSYYDDYLPNIDGSSPAVFGFNVKYKKGSSTVPSGHIKFQYQRGDLNLQSSEFDWLVVTNKVWAKFKGVATIDGMEGLFPFRVDAKDGDKLGGNQDDRFIIRIWAPDADPDHDEPIYRASGDVQGQIVIHTKGKKDPPPNEPITMVLPRFEFSSDYAEYLTAARKLAKMLEEKLNMGVDVFVPPGDSNESIDAAVSAVSNGDADLTMLPWVKYLVMDENDAGALPAVGAVRFGEIVYRGQFLTTSPDVNILAALDGKRICWAQWNSLSGYIVPSMMLLREEIEPSETSFAGNHFEVVNQLYHGGCETGAVFDDARDMLADQGFGDVYDLVRNIEGGYTEYLPNDQFIFGASFPDELREPMVQALIEISNDPDGMAVLDVFIPGLHGLDVANDSLYDGIRELMAHPKVNLTASAIWDKLNQPPPEGP